MEKSASLPNFEKGKKVVWWGCSSCSTDMDAVNNFLTGNSNILFNIHTTHALDIKRFSSFPVENEVLLAPGTYLEIINTLSVGPLTIVEMKEIPNAPFIKCIQPKPQDAKPPVSPLQRVPPQSHTPVAAPQPVTPLQQPAQSNRIPPQPTQTTPPQSNRIPPQPTQTPVQTASVTPLQPPKVCIGYPFLFFYFCRHVKNQSKRRPLPSNNQNPFRHLKKKQHGIYCPMFV